LTRVGVGVRGCGSLWYIVRYRDRILVLVLVLASKYY